MAKRDYYEVLCVERTVEIEEIKKSYRRLAIKFHPDKNPGDKAAEEKFKEVSAAFDVLGNEDKRKMYDEFGPEAAKLGFDPAKAKAYREYARQLLNQICCQAVFLTGCNGMGYSGNQPW